MRWNLLLAGATLAGLVTLTSDVAAQNEFRAPTIVERISDPVYMSWVAQAKVSACVDCHTEGPNLAAIAGGQSAKMSAFSRREEMERWVTLDKHTIARRRVEPYRADQEEAELNAMIDRLLEQQSGTIAALKAKGMELDASKLLPRDVPEDWMGDSNILSRRICDKLGYDVSKASGYERFRDNCLTCHGGYQDGESGFTFADKGQEQIGIDCLYCHQQGENSAWVLSHLDADKWRLLPPEVKTAAGMRDLVNTSVQAAVCLDCHVGNRDRNMFVTHEMYAAGHPPLPAVELQTFCKEMPQHWQTPSQLYQSLASFPGRDIYFQTNYPGVVTPATTAGDTYWNTRKLLLGALAARQQSLDLVIDSATAHQWADYSLYDCASCHHELQSDSRRQQRGFPAAPGRPRQPEWPDSLRNIAYRFYGGRGPQGQGTWQQLLQLEANLTDRFAEQPFGDPDQVRSAAQALRDEVSKAADGVARLPFGAPAARGVLKLLTQASADDLLTYDAARQVVWSIQVVTGELQDKGEPLPEGFSEIVETLGDPQTTGVLSRMPSGRKQFIYPTSLQGDLERRAAFDPERLTAQLEKLQALLAKPPGT